jgi:hypothetical protein
MGFGTGICSGQSRLMRRSNTILCAVFVKRRKMAYLVAISRLTNFAAQLQRENCSDDDAPITSLVSVAPS